MLLTSVRQITRTFITNFRPEQILRFASSSKSNSPFCAKGGVTCSTKVDNPCGERKKKEKGCGEKCPDTKSKKDKGKSKKSSSPPAENKSEKKADSKEQKKQNYVYSEDKPNEECIDFPCCPDPPQKYDEEFKQEIDERRKNRQYLTTWVECPPKRMVQKVVCEGKVKPAEPQKSRVPTGLAAPPKPASGDERCRKVTMPGCRAVAAGDERCKKEATPSDCTKVEAPYKSYSECNRNRPPPKRPTECDCLRARSMCQIFGKRKK